MSATPRFEVMRAFEITLTGRELRQMWLALYHNRGNKTREAFELLCDVVCDGRWNTHRDELERPETNLDLQREMSDFFSRNADREMTLRISEHLHYAWMDSARVAAKGALGSYPGRNAPQPPEIDREICQKLHAKLKSVRRETSRVPDALAPAEVLSAREAQESASDVLEAIGGDS